MRGSLPPGPDTTLSDSDGRWPRVFGSVVEEVTCVEAVVLCATDDLLLSAMDVAFDCRRDSCHAPLGEWDCAFSCSFCSCGGLATLAKVMMHSISSPA